MPVLVALAIVLGIVFTSPVSAQDFIFKGKPPEFEDFGYLVRGAAWTVPPGKEKIIFVCWENPGPTNETERSWIKDQIEKTLQRHSALKFRGWQQCAER